MNITRPSHHQGYRSQSIQVPSAYGLELYPTKLELRILTINLAINR